MGRRPAPVTHERKIGWRKYYYEEIEEGVVRIMNRDYVTIIDVGSLGEARAVLEDWERRQNILWKFGHYWPNRRNSA